LSDSLREDIWTFPYNLYFYAHQTSDILIKSDTTLCSAVHSNYKHTSYIRQLPERNHYV